MVKVMVMDTRMTMINATVTMMQSMEGKMTMMTINAEDMVIMMMVPSMEMLANLMEVMVTSLTAMTLVQAKYALHVAKLRHPRE